MRIPRLNDPVHYVSYGTPGGEYTRTCRAAIVTGVHPIDELTALPDRPTVGLFVMNPSGSFFNSCFYDEADRGGGTWHYPDNCPN